ncbi:uncharacterized protein BKA55DRAFT_574050 [Fusarium redolens]|uniref:Uncharacterized protein n=1 Tax=Fusarium redolens TaxID=48865 RepID=A0A9P9GRV2_FUSRE|nr:uncharacterized protein BKA55DRAFT_574050 [Fusarium redolens]KAH7244534.1 hypothetical protein BKA55DRAFT_574050 [Fusarium redolens]
MSEPEVFVFRWSRASEPTSGIESVANVGAETQWDLRVVVSTDSDDERFYAVFNSVIGNEEIWNVFQAEKQSSPTHTFGWKRLEDRSEVTWLHLLIPLPSKGLKQLRDKGGERDDEDHRVWLKPWVFLRWSLGNGHDTEPGRCRLRRISMLCFQSTIELVDRVNMLHQSPTWEYVLDDPFQLIQIIFESWFCRVDDVSWGVTRAARRTEQEVFNFVRCGRTVPRHIGQIDFRRPHIIAKDTIYMLEVLDAAILCLESVSNRHHALRENNSSGFNTDKWENTEQSLEYKKQLFHSTKLRILSTNQRMQTAINLLFSVQTVYDSNTMKQDSHAMKVLSYMAQLFLPFSVVCSVYGTPFIVDVTKSDTPFTPSSLAIKPQFWQLWAVSVPITIVLMTFIYAYTHWYDVKKIYRRGREFDLEGVENKLGLSLGDP